MPVDEPSPVVITAAPTAAAETPPEEVYGPIDIEGAGQEGEAAHDCPQGNGDEIVVCAKIDSNQHRIVLVSSPEATTMEDLDRSLTFDIGPAQIRPGGPPNSAGVGVHISF